MPVLTHNAFLYVIQLICFDMGAQFQFFLGYKFCCQSLISPLISQSDGWKIIFKIHNWKWGHILILFPLPQHIFSVALKVNFALFSLFKPRGRHFNNKGQWKGRTEGIKVCEEKVSSHTTLHVFLYIKNIFLIIRIWRQKLVKF